MMAGTDRFGRKDRHRLLAVVAWLLVFVNWPRPVFAATLLAVGTGFIVYNARVFWLTVVRKGEASSAAPIFGGIIAAAGVALLPLEGSWKWAWLPPLLDWGGLPMLLYHGIVRRARK